MAGTVVATVPAAVGDPAALLRQAEISKTSDPTQFADILKQLGGREASLNHSQRLQLDYLRAWQAAYHGDYATSDSLIRHVLDQPDETTLHFRAGLFVVNTLAERAHNEEAFQRLNTLLTTDLPGITDPNVRAQALTTAAMLYEEAGQYELALNYADRLLAMTPAIDEYTCKIQLSRLGALYKAGHLQGIDAQFQRGIDACLTAKNTLYANAIRVYVASLAIQRDQPRAAIRLLLDNYPDVLRSRYQMQISQFDALLAEAYLKVGKVALARQSARAVVAEGAPNKFPESRSIAYRVLYLIEKQQGNSAAALAYHEHYMAAEKGYAGDTSRRIAAYQAVQRELLANKLQVDTLSKQNEILQLQQALDRKAAETSRLYIVLLLSGLAFIAFWAYRIKRSQLRFMRQARRDGLTDIFNRQHFVNEAEQQLQSCRKSGREACLVLIDLDHFKAVNDTYGHAVGDRVLKRAVDACQAHLRSTDIFGRLGGEEFGIVLPDCTLEQVLGRTERIRLAIAEVVRGDATEEICVSASFGVATTKHSGHDLRQLLIHADDALYRAKREGRNRVSVSDGRAKPQLGAVAATVEGVQ